MLISNGALYPIMLNDCNLILDTLSVLLVLYYENCLGDPNCLLSEKYLGLIICPLEQ